VEVGDQHVPALYRATVLRGAHPLPALVVTPSPGLRRSRPGTSSTELHRPDARRARSSVVCSGAARRHNEEHGGEHGRRE
jgi:hypothetical protein